MHCCYHHQSNPIIDLTLTLVTHSDSDNMQSVASKKQACRTNHSIHIIVISSVLFHCPPGPLPLIQVSIHQVGQLQRHITWPCLFGLSHSLYYNLLASSQPYLLLSRLPTYYYPKFAIYMRQIRLLNKITRGSLYNMNTYLILLDEWVGIL